MSREWCHLQPWCVKDPGHPSDCHETLEERRARIHAAVMRDHPFVGDGPYCEHWSGTSKTGDYGTFTFSSQCGWSRETHPVDTLKS